MKVTKKTMALYVAEKTNVDFSSALEVVGGLFDMIKESVAEGNNVEIRGFGTLLAYQSNRTKVRNICKNEEMVIQSTKRIKFRASSKFVKQCNGK